MNALTLSEFFAGTDIDGGLREDADGNLIIELAVKDFFDYILSAVAEAQGQFSAEQAMAFIRGYAESRLQPAAVEQTMALLESYINYKKSAFALMQQPLLPRAKQTSEYYIATLKDSFEQLGQLRRQWLTPDAVDAFFGLEEAYSDFSLLKAEIILSPALSDAEKHQRIEQLRRELPAQLRESIDGRETFYERSEAVNKILASSKSLEEKRGELYQYYDVEVADRIITDLEREQSLKQRLADYERERDEICASGREKKELEYQINALTQRYFPSRQERVIAETYATGRRRSAGLCQY